MNVVSHRNLKATTKHADGVEDRYAKSREALARARQTLATGLPSDARTSQAPTPIFMVGGQDAHLRDIDGNEYVDYVLGYGPNLFGFSPEPILAAISRSFEHGLNYGLQHEAQSRLTEAITRVVPCADIVALASSGSEAVQVATRVARAATGRRVIVKFEGHWHGWADPLAVSVPGTEPVVSSLDGLSHGEPFTAGQALDGDVVVVEWNDLEPLEQLFRAQGERIAAVIMEPSASNAGVLIPRDGYLEGVRALCSNAGALLIFDEVITGFRLALGGAQERFGVTPDLCVLGKALGCGLPISAVAGTEHAMRVVADREVSHRGTYNGNSASVAAALAALEWLEVDGDQMYAQLERNASTLRSGMIEIASELGIDLHVQQVGGVVQTLFTELVDIVTYRDAMTSDGARSKAFAVGLLEHGVQILSGGKWLVSFAHTDRDVEETLVAVRRSLEALS